MSYHSFSLDPRTVLGVGPDASLDQIRDAYHAKSKKHHPDLGGDEWAFRMVSRAYEVLKTTAAAPRSQSWDTRVADVGQHGQAPDWSRIWSPTFSKPSPAAQADSDETTQGGAETRPDPEEDDRLESEYQEARSSITEPDELRTVDVELIWTRFEKEGLGKLLSTQEGDDATLSVCLVISWPPHELVDRAADFTSTGQTLRSLIDLFESLRSQKPVIAARSRIEDGQFVGWLSYVDVLTAQDAFLTLRDTFRGRGLSVKLYTRDERIPFDWYGAGHQPVMSDAS
jgi:DnaJ domain